MRPRISDLVWLPIALMLAAAPLVFLMSLEPDHGAGVQPIALSELAFAIKHSAISSIHAAEMAHGLACPSKGV